MFLADGTVAATGNFNMNTNEVTGIAALRPTATNILIGTGASSTSLRDTVIGNTNALTGSSNDTISIGSNMTLGNFINDDVLIGNNITVGAGGNEAICIGKGSSIGSGIQNLVIGNTASVTGSGNSNVVIGRGSSSSTNTGVIVGFGSSTSGSGSIIIGGGSNSNAIKSHIFGTALANTTANSLLIDADTNIRSNTNGTTDLGSVTNSFKDGFFSGSLIGTSKTSAVNDIVTGPVIAVSDNLASFNGTSGDIIKDSGISTTSISGGPFLPIVGGNITGTTDSSSSVTGSLTNAGGMGIAKKLYVGDSVFVNTTSATAKIVVSGGVQNTAGEDSCIRAISSSTATKIELNNTNGSGKIYELRSLNNGGFDITDRTGAATVFTIATSGDVGTPGIFTDSNVTDSSSSTTGAIISSGGIGVAKSMVVGANINAQGTTDSTSTSTGTIKTAGGIGAIKGIYSNNLNCVGTTDSTSTSTGIILTAGGIGAAKGVYANNLNCVGTTDSTTSSTGTIITAGGIGCAKQIRSAGKITVSASAASTGLDLATADCYANLRVIQNTLSTADGHIYIGFGGVATSNVFLYSNSSQVVRIEGGANVGFGGGSYGGGVGCFFIANRTTAPTSNPSSGGILYTESGALKYRGSAGTVSTIAPA